MPMPRPEKDETKDEFIDRCMSDGVMNEEYPDKDQRYAICNSIWYGDRSSRREVKMVTGTLEKRAFEITEIRAIKDKLIIERHASVYNRLSEDLGGFREQVAPGTFAQTIKEDDIYCLMNHNSDIILGRNRNGTLDLAEDKVGLAIRNTMPDTQHGRDTLTLVERGDITGMSFQFLVRTGGERWEDFEGYPLRTLLSVILRDTSPVAFAAYPQTDVSAAKRSLEAWQATQVPVGRLLKERRQRLIELE